MGLIETSVTQFLEWVEPKSTLWIAYSGGVDSHVLLHELVKQRENFPITLKAIHVDHGIHADAKVWSEHCVSVCKKLQVELFVAHLDRKSVV